MVLTIRIKLALATLFFLAIFYIILPKSVFAESAQFILKAPSNSVTSGQNTTVEVYATSDVPVNASELHLTYPSDVFKISIDSAGSAYGVKAQEVVSNGSITIAMGSITPLSGQNLFTKLNLTALKDGQISALQATTGTQILSSSTNKSIYTSTKIEAAGAPVDTSTPATVTPTTKPESKKDLVFRAIKEFFRRLFRL